MTYSGLVIGGHYAGEMRECPDKYMKLPIPVDNLDFSPNYNLRIEDMSAITQIEAYKHQRMHYCNNDTREEWQFNFWVPIDKENPQVFILDELMKAYAK